MRKDRLHRLDGDRREELVRRLCRFLERRPEVLFAYLFGSFAEGGPFRDVDVGVYLRPVERGDESSPELDLAAALSRDLHLPVEVRVLNRAPIPFAFHVLRGRLLHARDPEAHTRFMEHVVARYLDLQPLLRQATKEAFGP